VDALSAARRADPAFWAGRRVFVTGHTGFKGAWLCTLLLELGADVSGFSSGVPTNPSLFAVTGLGTRVRDLRGDVRDLASLREAVRTTAPDVVLHLAAQSLVRPSYDDPLGTLATNVMGTAHLLEAVRDAEVPVTVVVTSDKCYANQEWPWGYRENEPLGGHDPYSSSKACAELVSASYRSSFFRGSGLRVATGRAGNVIGGGDWSQDRLMADLMRAALASQPLRVRNPTAVRPWQHVLDCVEGYLLLAEALGSDPETEGAWNFGPAADDERSVAQIIHAVATRWPDPIDVLTDPGPHPHEAGRLTLDSARARTRLGWRPRWDADAAVAAVVEWYLAFRENADMEAAVRRQVQEHRSLAVPVAP
jgi:CDP-glucose 4,6-dehydratase